MMRTRIGVALGTAALGLVGLVGLTACGPALTNGTNASDSVEVSGDLTTEGQALAAMGFETADLTLGAPARDPRPVASTDPSAGAKRGDRVLGPHRGRVFLRRNVLHGEAVVQTKDGPKTVAVQRGTVTAITDKSVTVKSSDGFEQTWTFGSPLNVIDHRTTIQPNAVKVGATVGVAGPKENGGYTARLVVIGAPAPR
jgi:hypothetical protein